MRHELGHILGAEDTKEVHRTMHSTLDMDMRDCVDEPTAREVGKHFGIDYSLFRYCP
jgi:hypothetical protein